MQVFLRFVQKEFFHIFRDPLTMWILLGLPIVMLMLFGFAITTEVKNTKLAVYDPSGDVATKAIVHKLKANEYFIFTNTIHHPREIEKLFQEGKIGLAVVFSDRFYENLLHTGQAQVQLITDGTDPNTATTLTQYATNIINSYQLELLKNASIPYQIVPEIKLLYNPQMKGAYHFVPGVMGMILILICALMTSISIAREKEKGTMEILLVSPIKPILIILAKVIPYFVLSVVNLTTILILSVFVLKVPIVGSLWVLLFISILYIFVSLALGLLISSLVQTQLVALLISGMALMMPVVLLSGMLFPIENMPWFLQILSNFVPARWFILAVRKVMIKGVGIGEIFNETIILATMALFFIIVSLKKFKIRLE